MLGYQSGLAIQASGMVTDFTPGFPVRARLSIGGISGEAGNPLDARRVFINDATHGTPQQSGRTSFR
ncbi:MAG: hypothetical protein JSV86_09130 [Gemmatimonadota bacterium]|nr:MAG: hypothetical protein JSV86_09130 [Gemmatimonadota bacterium]